MKTQLLNALVERVNSIAGETSRSMEEAARSVSVLTEQTTSLTQLIEAMKQ